jgi:hypothetical protein
VFTGTFCPGNPDIISKAIGLGLFLPAPEAGSITHTASGKGQQRPIGIPTSMLEFSTDHPMANLFFFGNGRNASCAANHPKAGPDAPHRARVFNIFSTFFLNINDFDLHLSLHQPCRYQFLFRLFRIFRTTVIRPSRNGPDRMLTLC